MPAAVALSNTTLSAALTAKATTIKVASATTVALGYIGVVDGEAFLVNNIDLRSTGYLGVQRGYAGTVAKPHASGARVWMDQAAYFGQNTPAGLATLSDEVQPLIVLPITGERGAGVAKAFRVINDSWVEVSMQRIVNQRCVDPDTGYEYLLVGVASDAIAGELVVVDADGAATQLASTSKGRVAILVEAVTGAATAVSWALVVGKYASSNTTSDVTTAADLIAGTGTADILTSTGGNIIWGAACTVAPSSATSPGLGGCLATLYVANPWVSGEIHSFSSVGT